MMLWINKLLARIANRLWFIREQNRLNAIYQNPNITGIEGLRLEEYFTFDLPAENYRITFGPYVHFKRYCHILLFPQAELAINENVFFNNYCSINCLEKITIGANTQFGEGVKIYDHDHAYAYHSNVLKIEKAKFTTAPISIGSNCWIGSNVTILKGVTIGDNVIIGANNLIYKSIPANTVVKSTAGLMIETQL